MIMITPKNISRFFWKKALDYRPLNSSSSKSKVYVIYSVARLGDGISCSIAIRTIKNNIPDAKIIVICSEYNKDVFTSYPNIELLKISNDKNYKELWHAAKIIRKKYGPIALLFEPSSSNSLGPLFFMRSLKAEKNLTFRTDSMHMYTHAISEGMKYTSQAIYLSHNQALRLNGFKEIDDRFSFFIEQNAEKDVCEFISKNKLEQFILLNLHGFDEKRKITYEKASLLLKDIRAKNKIPIVLLCTPITAEKIHNLSCQYDSVFSFQDTKTIHHSAALIRNSSLLISPDTVVVHIASAYNIPTLAIFCDTQNMIMWPPRSQQSMSILVDDVNSISATVILECIEKFGTFS